MKKFSLNELAAEMQVLDMLEKAYFVGGGDGTAQSPYTYYQFTYFMNEGTFQGGYYEDEDGTIRNCGPEMVATGSSYYYSNAAGEYIAYIASSYKGLSETNSPEVISQMFQDHTYYYGGTEKDAWCAAFISTVLEQSGIVSAHSPRVNDYRNWGSATTNPQAGDVAIFKTGSHVGMVVKVEGDYVTIIHGNYSDAVVESKIHKSQLDFRTRP